MAIREAACGRALAAALPALLLILLSSPAAALKWQRVANVPANGFIAGGPSSPPKLAMWPSAGVGLLALQEPTPAQFLTTNQGRNWTRISNHYIRSVYMAGSSAAFAVGQLSSQYSPLNADSLLRWTRSDNSWSVSLPAPSGSVGISVTQMEVADGGQTVFVLGSLLFKDKLGLLVLSRPSDGARLQYVWRYQAAANKWDIIHSRKYSYNAQGSLSSTIASLSATNGTALWASWEGAQADGASAAGLVTFFNGTAWAAVRSTSRAPVRHLKGVAGQAFAAVQEGTASIHYRTGGQWVRKLTPSLKAAFFLPVTAPSTNFALVAEGGLSQQDALTARLWRWNGTAGTFSSAWEVGNVNVNDVVVDAASDQRAVAVSVLDTAQIVARRWFGNKWEPIDTLRCATGVVCAVGDLVAMPGGSALMTLVGRGGLWRLEA
ncbi:hypothetical protein COHA_001506 [Chlorella ohadii]|uniref:Uncharacterized protein n=1 Tax=Chlorella ohadii TaxID=2649997 RepID=A0AAD5DYD2_9CHLO|nr:hypothetical protein COHA_001506 [Chlorella ohadii]